eukprot:4469453-Prymnesium_polylepis.1
MAWIGPDSKAGSVLAVAEEFAEFRGAAVDVAESSMSRGLRDLFGQEMEDAFSQCSTFRSELRGCAKDVKALYAIGTEAWKNLSPDVDAKLHREHLSEVLRATLGSGGAAVTADDFVGAFATLCGEGRRGEFTAFEDPPPVANAIEWHQDWDPPFQCMTVMLGFPLADNFEGIGILPEVVRLSHQVSMEALQCEHYPITARINGRKDMFAAEVAAAEGLGVTNTHLVLSQFGRGRELLVYRDADVLHRSPRHATGLPGGREGFVRDAAWRFY